jgi:hypothetical protein
MPQERIADADLIVMGTVSMVTMAAPSPRVPITRHAPVWNRAMIEIEGVEKGTPPGKRVEALFPSSTDVMWYSVPKFYQGQQGIWILRRTAIEELGVTGYTALHPEDVQPKDRLAAIREALAAREGS